ncbi:MAG: hypothetical protein IIZ97_07715 [Prevotella sp.]|nr:hypothetical protein [Prevotella sp.]
MASAQVDCFVYADEGQTIVSGVSTEGVAKVNTEKELTIPCQVVKVLYNAFASLSNQNLDLSDMTIDGGNPEFEKQDGQNALSDVRQSLTAITINGSGMTTANIGTMLDGLGADNNIETIDIYNDAFPFDASITTTASLTKARVVLPANRVGSQQIGGAKIYGRFTMKEGAELATFCGNALFYDENDGSNFLFYIPTEIVEVNGEKRIHIQRVRYILPNQGILMHHTENSSLTVSLPRVYEKPHNEQYEADETRFAGNMLVGVTEPTYIGKISEKSGDTYVNMILKSGFFYPTLGGILGANRAYLQVKQSDLQNARIGIAFGEEDEATNIHPHTSEGTHQTSTFNHQPSQWYTFSGQRLADRPRQPGFYKKVKK